MNLFAIQSEHFLKIINPSKLTDPITNMPLPLWKILIYDQLTSNLITNFKIRDLRESNITLHLNVNDPKEPLPGVEAIYLLSNDPVSLEQCLKDIERGLFNSIFINFIGSISKQSLTHFSKTIIKLRKTHLVQDIKQYPLEFFPVTSNSFTFNLPMSYRNEQIDFEQQLINKLLNFFAALDFIPLIAYEKNSVRCQRIHSELASRIQSKMSDVFMPDFDRVQKNNKTLLILNESGEDVSSFLFRSFQYLPLLAEGFQLFQNNSAFNSVKTEEFKVSIDMKNDKFIQVNQTVDYPSIGLLIHQEVESTKLEFDKIVKRPENEFDDLAFSDNFNEALEAVPMITEKKKNNENHVRLATLLAAKIERNHLEKVCVLSNQILRNKRVSSEFLPELEIVLKSSEIPAAEKLRLFILLNLNWQIDLKEYEKFEGFLRSGLTLNIPQTAFLEKIKTGKFANNNPSGSFLSKFKNVAVQKIKNMGSEKYRCKISNLVNNFFKKRDFEELKVVSLTKSIDALNPDNILQIIVFSLDGGNFHEMYEVLDLAQQLKKEGLYGMSEFVTGTQFVDKLINENC